MVVKRGTCNSCLNLSKEGVYRRLMTSLVPMFFLSIFKIIDEGASGSTLSAPREQKMLMVAFIHKKPWDMC